MEVREVAILRCKYCGAFFHRGKWYRRGLEEAFRKHVADYIHGEVVELEISENNGEANVAVTVQGSVNPEIPPRKAKYNISVKFIFDICPSCREALSKRELAVVQIRAAPRPINSDIKSKILSILNQELFKLKNKRIGYISDIKEYKYGIDIYTTSVNLARHLAYVISRVFPSHVLETAKVVGVKDGRKIYHMTYLVRIVTLRAGDKVLDRGVEKVVIDVKGREIILLNRANGQREVLFIESSPNLILINNE